MGRLFLVGVWTGQSTDLRLGLPIRYFPNSPAFTHFDLPDVYEASNESS